MFVVITTLLATFAQFVFVVRTCHDTITTCFLLLFGDFLHRCPETSVIEMWRDIPSTQLTFPRNRHLHLGNRSDRLILVALRIRLNNPPLDRTKNIVVVIHHSEQFDRCRGEGFLEIHLRRCRNESLLRARSAEFLQ